MSGIYSCDASRTPVRRRTPEERSAGKCTTRHLINDRRGEYADDNPRPFLTAISNTSCPAEDALTSTAPALAAPSPLASTLSTSPENSWWLADSTPTAAVDEALRFPSPAFPVSCSEEGVKRGEGGKEGAERPPTLVYTLIRCAKHCAFHALASILCKNTRSPGCPFGRRSDVSDANAPESWKLDIVRDMSPT